MTVAAPRRPGAVRPHWHYSARQIAWAGVDVILTPHCGGCERRGHRFCPACRTSLRYLRPPLCEQCGDPIQAAGLCPSCRVGAPAASPLSGLRSAAFFEGPLQKALHGLKYKRDIILADTLAQVLFEAWPALALPGDLVVPIPLSAERLHERGYNQAGLLARAFAELAGLPFAPAGAARTRHTASQVGLSSDMRYVNVRGAFRAERRLVAGRSVVLVDDVCTTGATLSACAEALRAAGAAAVWGFTLARATTFRMRSGPARPAQPGTALPMVGPEDTRA